MGARAREEAEARRQEVEQLATLSLRGDATVQECMAHIKVRFRCCPVTNSTSSA